MIARTVTVSPWKKDHVNVTKPFIDNCQSFIVFLATNYNLVFVALSFTVGNSICQTLLSIDAFYEMPVYENYTGRIKSFFSHKDTKKVK